MKRRECPCCNEEVPIKYFLKHMLAGKKGFSFVEKEKGFVCKKCNNPILSAEKKDKSMKYLLGFSLVPMALFGFNDIAFISMENLINLLKALSVSFTILLVGVFRQYYKIDFICNDESSDEYNETSIHS